MERSHEHDTCPEHGTQEVVGYSSTGGADPYGINVLKCGHGVACFGPGEDNVIVRDHMKPPVPDYDTRESEARQAMADEATHCAICGERFTASDEIAEMYDPDASEELVGMGKADGIVHAQCGLWRGWQVS